MAWEAVRSFPASRSGPHRPRIETSANHQISESSNLRFEDLRILMSASSDCNFQNLEICSWCSGSDMQFSFRVSSIPDSPLDRRLLSSKIELHCCARTNTVVSVCGTYSALFLLMLCSGGRNWPKLDRNCFKVCAAQEAVRTRPKVHGVWHRGLCCTRRCQGIGRVYSRGFAHAADTQTITVTRNSPTRTAGVCHSGRSLVAVHRWLLFDAF